MEHHTGSTSRKLPEPIQLGAGSDSSRDSTGTVVALAVLPPSATVPAVAALMNRLRASGYAVAAHEVGTPVLMLTGVTGAEARALPEEEQLVERVVIPDTKYRLARRDVRPEGTIVDVSGVQVGDGDFVVVAGPCAVESPAQLLTIARSVDAAGAVLLRGGAFKPRTSPYEFQGLGLDGVRTLEDVRGVTGMPFITEVMRPALVEQMRDMVDGFQVGARNMQNFDLLRALAKADRPVLLKRNPGATAEEWLLAAEYLLAGGNDQVILCERGIRTFSTDTRYTLDLATMALVKRSTHLPVIVDPSHATGDPTLIAPMARAALAAGADGVMVEVHNDPASALSDGFQALTPDELSDLVAELKAMAALLGRALTTRPSIAVDSPAVPHGGARTALTAASAANADDASSSAATSTASPADSNS